VSSTNENFHFYKNKISTLVGTIGCCVMEPGSSQSKEIGSTWQYATSEAFIETITVLLQGQLLLSNVFQAKRI
jgi:hypothetical protein